MHKKRENQNVPKHIQVKEYFFEFLFVITVTSFLHLGILAIKFILMTIREDGCVHYFRPYLEYLENL